MKNEALDKSIRDFMKWKNDPIMMHQEEDFELKLRELFKKKGEKCKITEKTLR